MLFKSFYKYILLLIISLASSYVFSNQIVLNCKLEKIGTQQNHEGVIQENSKQQIFVFNDIPPLIISFKPTKYDALKYELGEDWEATRFTKNGS